MEINNITWKIENKTNTYFFVGMRWKDEHEKDHYDCVLCCDMFGFDVCVPSGGKIKCNSREELIYKAKEFLMSMHDPFKYSIEKINANIEKNVSAASHAMHLRISEFRALLFDQTQRLQA